MRMIAVVLSLVGFPLAALPAYAKPASKPGPGADAALQVTLAAIVDAFRIALEKAPEAKVSDRAKARRFAVNLRALLVKASKADLIVESPANHPVAKAVKKANEVQFDLILEYLKAAMVKAWPKLSTVFWWVGVIQGALESPEANVGAAFEFCSPTGMQKEVGNRFVRNMMATYEPDEFARVLAQKPGCANSILGYFVADPAGQGAAAPHPVVR